MMTFAYKVELEGNDGFVLDTDLLDTGRLGYLSTDVTSYVRSVSCKRGKSTNLDRFTAGQLSVVFDNRDRTFDPSYVSSPLYGAIVPRRRIRFYAGYDSNSLHSQFVGFIDDWNFDYDVSGDSTATASASDAFTVLANQNVTLTTPTQEDSDARILRVLTNSQVAWPLEDYFETGAAGICNTVSYSGNALDYLLQVAESEQGLLYVNRSGVLTFLGWNYFTTPAGVTADLPFSDSGTSTVLPFSALETNYGTEQLYNYVTVTGSPGTVTSQDVTSQIDYRVSAYDLATLCAGTARMQLLADNLIATYKDPVFRVSGVEVPIEGYERYYAPNTATGSAAISAIFQADFGYTASIDWTPNGLGSALFSLGVVIGKTIQATPERLDVNFELGPYQYRSVI